MTSLRLQDCLEGNFCADFGKPRVATAKIITKKVFFEVILELEKVTLAFLSS